MVPWSWSFLGLVIFFFLLSSFGFYTIYFQYLVPLTLLGCVVIDESVWEDVLSLVFVMFVASYSCVDFFFFFFFFFFLRQTTLCMVCLKSPCVFFLGGGLGFFCCFGKKNLGLLSCSSLCTALWCINFHFNACMTIFSFLIHTWAHHFWVFCDGCFYFLVVFARPCSLFASLSS